MNLKNKSIFQHFFVKEKSISNLKKSVTKRSRKFLLNISLLNIYMYTIGFVIYICYNEGVKFSNCTHLNIISKYNI